MKALQIIFAAACYVLACGGVYALGLWVGSIRHGSKFCPREPLNTTH